MFPLLALGFAALYMLGSGAPRKRAYLLEGGRLYTIRGTFPGSQQLAVSAITVLGGVVGNAKQSGQQTRVTFQWAPPVDTAVEVPATLNPFGVYVEHIEEVESV